MTPAAGNSHSKDSLLGILALVGTGLAWSLGGLFIKVLDWNPWAIAGSRSLLAALVLLAFSRGRPLKFSRIQAAGALAYSVCMILFVFANKNTTAANAIFLQYTAPLFTAFLGAVFLKERVRFYHWGALILTGLGLFLLVSPGGGGNINGDLLALASGLAFSLTFIIGRRQPDGGAGSLLLAHGMTALAGLGLAAFLPWPQVTLGSLGAVAVLGIVQLGAASLLFSYGLKRVTALSANLTTVVEPLFNPLWVFLVLGEVPGPAVFWGGALVVLGILGSSVWPVLFQGSAKGKTPVSAQPDKSTQT